MDALLKCRPIAESAVFKAYRNSSAVEVAAAKQKYWLHSLNEATRLLMAEHGA